MEIFAIIMTKAKYSCGLACSSFFFYQSLQMLINSISLVLSESLVYTCEPQAWRYLLWPVLVIHVQPETTNFGYITKVVGSGDSKNHGEGLGFVKKFKNNPIQGCINSLGMKPLDIAKVGNPDQPNNRGNYLLST